MLECWSYRSIKVIVWLPIVIFTFPVVVSHPLTRIHLLAFKLFSFGFFSCSVLLLNFYLQLESLLWSTNVDNETYGSGLFCFHSFIFNKYRFKYANTDVVQRFLLCIKQHIHTYMCPTHVVLMETALYLLVSPSIHIVAKINFSMHITKGKNIASFLH